MFSRGLRDNASCITVFTSVPPGGPSNNEKTMIER